MAQQASAATTDGALSIDETKATAADQQHEDLPYVAFGNQAFDLASSPAMVQQALAAVSDVTLSVDKTYATTADEQDDRLQAEGNEILVIANRMRDQVDAPQPPLVTLDEAAIASYGAASLSDLITALAPETGSGRGRGSGVPVVLLNGQRISNFRELQNFPPEAIRRLEVLPEEVALRFGYPPDQRVINFIIKSNFSSRSIEARYGQPDRGDTYTGTLVASLLNVNGPRRLNITVSGDRTTPLTEADRNVIQSPSTLPTVASDPDPAAFRTLIPYNRDLGIYGTWSTGLGEGSRAGSFSLNLAITHNDIMSLSGLNSVLLTAPDGTTALRTLGDPLAQTSHTVAVRGGAVLNMPVGAWQFTATLDASHYDTEVLSDLRTDTSALVAAAAAGLLAINGPLPRFTSAGVNRVQTKNDSLASLATFAGTPITLPAGGLATTLKAGFTYIGLASSSNQTANGKTRLRRGDFSAGINIGIPITSRHNHVLAGIGDVTLNFSAGVDRLSDFGTLTDWSAGMTWGLTDKLSLQASYIVNQVAPTLASLGNPLITTFNVPVYDFTTGQTVLVTTLSGGNRGLQREQDRDLKFGANWELPLLKKSTLIVEYFRNNSDNVTRPFPLLTPAIEAAFSSRVVRDSGGRLVSIDRRPVTIYRESISRLRYGVNLSGTIGKPNPSKGILGGFDGAGSGRHGHRLDDRGPGTMAMMGQGGQGRWTFSIYHAIQFQNRVVVVPGGPVLNLLNGDALSGSGVARHSLEMEGGAFYKGIGLRLDGKYTAPTNVRASGAPGSSDLHFGAFATFNLRLFADLGQIKGLPNASPFFKGVRLSLRVDNIFDMRHKVTDASGAVPLSYQPDLLDPNGRFIGVELRKTF